MVLPFESWLDWEPNCKKKKKGGNNCAASASVKNGVSKGGGRDWLLAAGFVFWGLYAELPALKTKETGGWDPNLASHRDDPSTNSSYSSERYGRQREERKERGGEKTEETIRGKEERQAQVGLSYTGKGWDLVKI